jgi:predicted kinase
MDAYVMVGIPGSGKTTYARGLAKETNAVLVEGDAIRAELFGDASIYGRWDEVWSKIDETVEDNAGSDLILDGTFETASLRAEALALLRSYGYTDVHLIVMQTSLATALARNWERKRNVPDYIAKEKFDRLQKSLPSIQNEGFSKVTFVEQGIIVQG